MQNIFQAFSIENEIIQHTSKAFKIILFAAIFCKTKPIQRPTLDRHFTHYAMGIFRSSDHFKFHFNAELALQIERKSLVEAISSIFHTTHLSK